MIRTGDRNYIDSSNRDQKAADPEMSGRKHRDTHVDIALER